MPEEIRDELCAEYRAAIYPRAATGKLGTVHFQFAPQVLYDRRSFEHIEECIAQQPSCRLAIESRNKSWFDGENGQKTLAFERERKLVNVIVDEPQGVANYIPSIWEVTNRELAIVRLHGRNHETWAKKGLTSSAQRFNYDYSDAEWEELAEPIAQVARNSFTTHVILNNNHQDQGQRNAARLRTTLQRESYRRTDRILALAWLGRPALPLGMRGLRDRGPAASRIYAGRFQSIVRAVEERCSGYGPHCGQAPQNRH